MKKCCSVCILMALLVFGTAGTIFAQGTEAGISVGPWFAGGMYVEDIDDEIMKDTSFMVKGYLDKYVGDSFAMGIYTLYSPLTFSYNPNPLIDVAVDGSSFEIGFAVKPIFPISDQIKAKPGLSLGYRKMSADSDDLGNANDSDGLNIGFSLEGQYDMGQSIKPYVEFGFLTQPVGGNSETSITYGPIMYLTVGTAFDL